MVSRRQFIQSLTAAGITVSLAGCSNNTNNGNGTNKVEPQLDPPSLGDPNKPRLAVFEDYACPHCRTFSLEFFPKLKKDFIDTNKIEYIHRDLPIPVSSYSLPAAMAGRAIQDLVGNDAFWEYKKIIFQNQPGLDYGLIGQAATKVGGDKKKILEKTKNNVYKDHIERDKNIAKEFNVKATPTLVYVDTGEILELSDYPTFKDKLNTKLQS